jgi:myo-inositol-1(or 4)-monophosphatase
VDERAPVVTELAAEPFRLETLVAMEAVKQALTIAGRGVGAEGVREKGERDPVTVADIAVEDTVRSILGDVLGVPVIGEERGGEAPADGSPYWLVDPICGTRNFASGIPLYCVNLALVEGGEIAVAVVGDPSRSEIDVAERGRGAWRLKDGNRQRLTTSDESRTIVIEEGKAKGNRREQAAQFTATAIRADRWDCRSLGTTLASPYVAAGRLAAYVVFWVPAIHTAAGSLLVTEAGGTVSDIDGHPWVVDSDSFVGSANRHLHEELLNVAGTLPVSGPGGRRR